MVIEIYYDAHQELNWFQSLDERLNEADAVLLQGRGRNKQEIVNDLIIYDRPDIILLIDGEPKLVLEKTEEVPSGHNVGQRIGRLARAVEMSVPIVKFFPFLAMKHGAYASRCFVRPNIFLAFQKMKEFHDVHALAINWICDNHFELIRDGSENTLIQQLIKGFIDNGFVFDGLQTAAHVESLMAKEHNERVGQSIHYRRLAPSLTIVKTKDLADSVLSNFEDATISSDRLSRDESLVYEIGMTPQNCRREDPYTGTQFIYDYCYCRTGSTISDRKRNFVLHFPNISKRRWIEANPMDMGRKSFLWYVLADFMILRDGVLTRGDNFEQEIERTRDIRAF